MKTKKPKHITEEHPVLKEIQQVMLDKMYEAFKTTWRDQGNRFEAMHTIQNEIYHRVKKVLENT